jgi:hypothetical protein
MGMNAKSIFTVAVMLLLTACSQPTLQSGPDAETTEDGLVRLDHATLTNTYVRPGANLQNYKAIQLISVGVDYRSVRASPANWYPAPGRNEYNLTSTEKTSLEALVNEIFAEEFAKSEYFTMTDKPGPGVLVVKAGLVDVVSFVPLERPARDYVFLSELGQTTLILEVDDSITGESFVRASDRKRVDSNRANQVMLRESNPVTNRQEVKRFMRLWARQLVVGLDELHEQGEI